MTDFNPWVKYADHPHVSDRRDLPRIRREWLGDQVCIRLMARRGHAHRRTSVRYYWGRLVQATNPEHVAVEDRHGIVHPIHYTRVLQVWNLTQKVP